MTGLMLFLFLLVGAVLGVWIYRCQKKEQCSVKGEGALILKHLRRGKSITQEQAKALYGIKHLRSVISHLRHKYGQDIQTVTKDKKAVYSKK
jgi:prepilin signal peptidase PulO-like enzyme (type II secretory pathway)